MPIAAIDYTQSTEGLLMLQHINRPDPTIFLIRRQTGGALRDGPTAATMVIYTREDEGPLSRAAEGPRDGVGV
jgi:hypothetical protein